MGTNRTFEAKPDQELFWKKVRRGDSCWEWIGAISTTGCGVFRTKKAHRVVAYWEGILDHLDSELLVCHHCDNPRCVRPDHLYAGTHQDNMDDMMRRGRWRNGYSSQRQE